LSARRRHRRLHDNVSDRSCRRLVASEKTEDNEMSRLWKDFGGEPFLINPRLFIVNSPRSKKRMSSKKHRRKPRRNWVSSGAIANPKGRHHRRPRRNFIRWNAHRRRTRRNPPSLMRVAGIALPSLETIGFASVGLLGAPA